MPKTKLPKIKGLAAVEYAIIAATIALILITVTTNLGTEIKNTFNTVVDKLKSSRTSNN